MGMVGFDHEKKNYNVASGNMYANCVQAEGK